MYENTDRPLRQGLRDAHQSSWDKIGAAGAFWNGTQRVAMVTQARAAANCQLCTQRIDALSPHAVTGEHSSTSELPANAIDVIHRLSTDPGRLTRDWFDQTVGATLSLPAYVELVSVVTSSVIIDSQHRAVGLLPPELPVVLAGAPSEERNEQAVEAGAWLPISAGSDSLSDTGLPDDPNITRALGLVPSAVALFFTTFRPHYTLKNIPLSISQTVAEFIASRVSAHNQCFY